MAYDFTKLNEKLAHTEAENYEYIAYQNGTIGQSFLEEGYV